MKLYILILWLAFFVCNPNLTYTQTTTTPTIDSLEKVIGTLTDTTERIKTLLALSKNYYCGTQAELYGQQALALSTGLKDTMLLTEIYFRLSWIAHCNENLDSANYWLNKTFPICEKNENHYCLYRYYLLSATYLSYYPEDELLENYFQKAYYHSAKVEDTYFRGIALNNWSVFLMKGGQYARAKNKLEEAVSYIDSTYDMAQRGRLHYNLARAYKGTNQVNKSIDYFLEAFALRKQTTNPAGVGEVYVRLAEILIEDTLQHYSAQYPLIFKTVSAPTIPALLDSAYQKSLPTYATGLMKPIFENQIRYYESQKDYELAFYYLQKLKELDESVLLGEENLKGLVSIKTKYEKQVLENKVLKAELTQKQIRTERNYLLFGLVLLLLISITGWILFQQKAMIRQAKIERKEQEIKDLQTQQQILTMSAMLEGQEKERSRIAKDLHDGLGGLLSSIKHNILNTISVHSLKTDAEVLLNEAYSEVRRIAHNMMPLSLQRLGLQHALEDFCNQQRIGQSFDVFFKTYGQTKRLSETKEIMLYRVVQEAFNNIQKHANANEVLLQMTYGEDWLNITIEDDGVGFDKNTPKHEDGLGLHSMLSRIQYIDGTCSIESDIDEGTAIHITVNTEMDARKN